MAKPPLLAELRRIAGGRALLGAAVGSGLAARCAAAGGCDLLLALSAGRFRAAGAGSLAAFMPYGDANAMTRQLLVEEVLPRAGGVPVIAGALGHDPQRGVERLVADYAELGVAGIANWPAAGFVDGALRAAMEEEGLGVAAEIALLAAARARGLLAVGFALAVEDVRRLAPVSDLLVLDLGLTREPGDGGPDALRRDIARLNQLAAAGRASGAALLLAFGGGIVSADDLGELLRHGDVDGFAGGSAFERLPVEEAITGTVRRFAAVAAGHAHGGEGLPELIGRSAPMRELGRLIRRVAPTDVAVCIEGPSGCGKELVAAALHRLGRRAGGPFITLNCGALPDGLVEGELFGAERGAYTGAERTRIGKFEAAHGGTLLLDEVADLSAHAQVALLRALQNREIVRLGANRALPVDVRVVAASNRPLARLVAEGRFRADLYYRLNQVTLRVPPLSERRDDLPLLVAHFLPVVARQVGRELRAVAPSFLARLSAHAWPGNVRELQHALVQAAVHEDGEVLRGARFAPVGHAIARPAGDRAARRRQAEQAIAESGGNKRRAAVMLGVSRKTLYAWLAR